MNIKVLILGGGLQALSTAYSLWKMNYYVCCIATNDEEVRFSRFVNTFYPLQSSNILEQILFVIHKEQISVVIPMSDQMAELVSKYKTNIEDATGHTCPAPDYNVFLLAADKSKLMSFCEQHHFAHPRTRPLTRDNINEVAEYVGFPSLIKPNRSVGARGITLVHSIEELRHLYPSIVKRYGNASLQEFVDNKGLPYYNVMLYRNSDGEIFGSTIIEILRFFPINGGSSSLCRTIDDSRLLMECVNVLNQLNWVGMADFDVLKNKDGEYKIIEINPRVPASLRAADIAGVNFPEIIINDTLGQLQKKYTYKTGMYLRYFGLDIMWFINSTERFKAKPNWFFCIGRKTYFQDIYAQDPYTWFAWFISGFKRFLEKRKHLHN